MMMNLDSEMNFEAFMPVISTIYFEYYARDHVMYYPI